MSIFDPEKISTNLFKQVSVIKPIDTRNFFARGQKNRRQSETHTVRMRQDIFLPSIYYFKSGWRFLNCLEQISVSRPGGMKTCENSVGSKTDIIHDMAFQKFIGLRGAFLAKLTQLARFSGCLKQKRIAMIHKLTDEAGINTNISPMF